MNPRPAAAEWEPHYAEVARQLVAKSGLPVVVLGSERDDVLFETVVVHGFDAFGREVAFVVGDVEGRELDVRDERHTDAHFLERLGRSGRRRPPTRSSDLQSPRPRGLRIQRSLRARRRG